MTTTDGRLEVHVIGGKQGESIVIRLPDGQWGVVDCYTSSLAEPTANPTVQFLLQQRVERLLFVCLTHPHEDHYRGLSHLLERFQPAYFWQSAAVTPQYLQYCLRYLAGSATADEMDSVTDLIRTYQLVKRQRQAGTLKIKMVLDTAQLFLERYANSPVGQNEVRIIGLAPSSANIETYQGNLHRCFDADNKLKDALPSIGHNDISTGILIMYGATRIVLGGDVERADWQHALNRFGAELVASAVKVSHHGSTNGYCEELWNVFCTNGEAVSIVTPFYAQKLPTLAGLQHIRTYTRNILTTCTDAVRAFAMNELSPWPELAPAIRATLEHDLSAFAPVRHFGVGRCSLTFDNINSLPAIRLSGAAGTLAEIFP